MYQIKKLVFLLLIFLLSACYEVDMVIELNPDGSGVFKRSMNFNRATEDQKDKIREFMKMSDNNGFGSELLKIKDNFPAPFFKIIKNEIDEENLTTYTEIEFQDINRLFAVDKKVSGLNGVSFNVDKSHIIFSIVRNEDLIDGSKRNSASLQSNPLASISARITNAFINKLNNEKIETFYEFIGDDKNAVVRWQDKLEIANHSITKSRIKHSFAKYPVLTPTSSKYKTATWVVKDNKSNNSLELELVLPIPVSKEKTYLGYDQKFLLSGKYNDGRQASLKEDRFASTDKINSFTDNFVKEGGGNFKLPINLSFPENPVEFLDSLMVRIRVLSVKNTKRFELGKPVNGKTYEVDSLKFTIDHTEKNINITSDGPSHLFKQFLITTPNGNTMPIKPEFGHINKSRFKNIPLLQNSVFSAEYYSDAQYEWLDSKAPKLILSRPYSLQADEKPTETFSLQKLFPEIRKFPVVDESIYKDLDSFKNYWMTLPDNQVIPALLVVSDNMDKFKKKWEIYTWYQGKLGRSLKEREGFFESNKNTLGDYMFRLFLNKPNQNDNTAILYLLTNLELTDTFKQNAITAIKQGKLKKGISIIFSSDISPAERELLKDIFYNTAHDWVENQNLFNLLTKGNDPDLKLAREVINSDNYHEFVKDRAFEVILNYDKNISSDFIKPFIIDPETRRSAIKAINSKLFKSRPKGEITNEQISEIIRPLKPLFEDIEQLSDDFEVKDVKAILNAINSVKVEAGNNNF